MRVSVIVPTYNRVHMVTEAIDSILNQTFKDFELIIVDNYSSDDTESIVKSYVDKRIRYFRNQNNGLVSVNRNYGIEKSHGEYIAFLDDDDLWLPEKLEKQVELLDSNKELALVYSDCYIIDGDGSLRENTYFHGIRPFRENVFNELLKGNFIPMLTVAVRREALDKVGVFNLRYKICQDYDLWLRIAKYYPIDFIEQPLAKYRFYGESSSQKNIVLAWQELLHIIDYWLDRNQGIKRELGSNIRRRKVGLYRAILSTAIRHIYRNKDAKSVRELGSLVKYLLRPKKE